MSEIPDEILAILINRAVYARDNIPFEDDNLRRKRYFAAKNKRGRKKPQNTTAKKTFNQLYKNGTLLKAKSACKKCGNFYFTILRKNIYKVGEMDLECDCKICHTSNIITVNI